MDIPACLQGRRAISTVGVAAVALLAMLTLGAASGAEAQHDYTPYNPTDPTDYTPYNPTNPVDYVADDPTLESQEDRGFTPPSSPQVAYPGPFSAETLAAVASGAFGFGGPDALVTADTRTGPTAELAVTGLTVELPVSIGLALLAAGTTAAVAARRKD